jgi:MFS transporter, CP family, cyanate transporter
MQHAACREHGLKKGASVNKSATARAAFSLLWICGVSLRLTVLSVPPLISMIQRDLDLSGTQIGLLSGMPVFAIVAAPGSMLVARIGVRGALVSGLLIAAGGTLLRIGAANAWQLY